MGEQGYTIVQGVAVENDALRIAEKITEYNPRLKLQYLAENAALGDPPFQIVETGLDGREHIVMYAWELDDRLLHRLYMADTFSRDVLKELDKHNDRVKKHVKDEIADARVDAHEKLHAAMNSHKDTYSIKDEYTGKKITVHSHLPPDVERPV